MSQFGGVAVEWSPLGKVPPRRLTCWFCNADVASNEGWLGKVPGTPHIHATWVCPLCARPNYFDSKGTQFPGVAFGEVVESIKDEGVRLLYEEARRATSASCFTSAVLCCRKILMHVAVDMEAEEGLRFIEYVNYLAEKNWVPPNGKGWVDYIRTRSNDANHEIELMTEDDAKKLLKFTGTLLKFIYEFGAETEALAAPKK